MNMRTLFLRRFELERQKKPALVLIKKDGHSVNYTWEAYEEAAIAISEGLKKEGVKKRDFVAIIPLNLPESFFALWGTILAEATPVPIHAQLVRQAGQTDLKKILNDCKPKLILANKHLGEYLTEIKHLTVEEILVRGEMTCYNKKISIDQIHADLNQQESYPEPEKKQEEILIMPYTSGTSGNPKGVMLSHKNISDRIEAVNKELGTVPNERILSYLPLGHISELIATLFGQIYGGYTVFFTEYAAEAVADREKLKANFPAILQKVRPTVFLGVPKVWINFRREIENRTNNLPVWARLITTFFKRRLAKKGLGFQDTRIFISTGSKLNREEREFFRDLFGLDILDIYGQTEIAGPLTINGRVIGQTQAMLSGAEREIVISGNCVMAGYYENEEANKKVFSRDADGKRLYHSGDQGVTLFGNKIFCAGRLGDDFKLANGEFVTLDKIETLEEKIKRLDPRIIEAIVCGADKPYVVAIIFCDDCLDGDLNHKIRETLPGIGEGMFNPKNFALVKADKLELTPTLKVKRKVMLKKLESVIDSLYP